MARERELSITLPVELIDRLDAMGRRYDQSPSSLIEQALTVWVSVDEAKMELLRIASADVDAGNFVEDDEIGDWLNRLDAEGVHGHAAR